MMILRTKIVWVMVFIAMLATTWRTVGTAVAQKAAVPKPQDKLAIGEDEAKQLLLLIDTEKNGKIDRKSTRLNSSHQIISYAVFCLKKKKTGNVELKPRTTRPLPIRTRGMRADRSVDLP